MRNVFRNLASVVPGPLVAWINAWISPLSETVLTHPHWQFTADQTASALGTIEAVVIVAAYRTRSQAELGLKATRFLLAALVFVVVSFAAYYYLSRGGTRSEVEAVKIGWMFSYIFMLLCLVASITFAALAVTRGRRKGSSARTLFLWAAFAFVVGSCAAYYLIREGIRSEIEMLVHIFLLLCLATSITLAVLGVMRWRKATSASTAATAQKSQGNEVASPPRQ